MCELPLPASPGRELRLRNHALSLPRPHPLRRIPRRRRLRLFPNVTEDPGTARRGRNCCGSFDYSWTGPRWEARIGYRYRWFRTAAVNGCLGAKHGSEVRLMAINE